MHRIEKNHKNQQYVWEHLVTVMTTIMCPISEFWKVKWVCKAWPARVPNKKWIFHSSECLEKYIFIDVKVSSFKLGSNFRTKKQPKRQIRWENDWKKASEFCWNGTASNFSTTENDNFRQKQTTVQMSTYLGTGKSTQQNLAFNTQMITAWKFKSSKWGVEDGRILSGRLVKHLESRHQVTIHWASISKLTIGNN